MPEFHWGSKIQIAEHLHHLWATQKKTKKTNTNILIIRQGKYLGLLAVGQVSDYITRVYQTAVCLNVVDQCVCTFLWIEGKITTGIPTVVREARLAETYQ